MRLTPNFKSSEFTVSWDYPKLARKIKLTETDTVKLFYICRLILQPARDDFHEDEFNVNSGKRIVELNTLIGGWKNSDHIFRGFSCAVDFTVEDREKLFGIYKFIHENCRFSIGECILYLDATWQPIFIHVSLPTKRYWQRFRYSYNDGKLFGPIGDLPGWVIDEIFRKRR